MIIFVIFYINESKLVTNGRLVDLRNHRKHNVNHYVTDYNRNVISTCFCMKPLLSNVLYNFKQCVDSECDWFAIFVKHLTEFSYFLVSAMSWFQSQ